MPGKRGGGDSNRLQIASSKGDQPLPALAKYSRKGVSEYNSTGHEHLAHTNQVWPSPASTPATSATIGDIPDTRRSGSRGNPLANYRR